MSKAGSQKQDHLTSSEKALVGTEVENALKP
jgi:hypothetical protein